VLGLVLSTVVAHAEEPEAESATATPPLSSGPLEIIHIQLSEPPQASPSPKSIQPLEEIVVTAQKREQWLLDVPLSARGWTRRASAMSARCSA
jgi:hypothetical protein